MSDFPTLLRIDGIDVLRLEPPEAGSSVPRLSGIFTDDQGVELFTINQNEWIGSLNCWDIETTGRCITIRTGPRRIGLQFEIEGRSRLRVTRMEMLFGGVHEVANSAELAVGSLNGFGGIYLSFGFSVFRGGEALLDINTDELKGQPTGIVWSVGREFIWMEPGLSSVVEPRAWLSHRLKSEKLLHPHCRRSSDLASPLGHCTGNTLERSLL